MISCNIYFLFEIFWFLPNKCYSLFHLQKNKNKNKRRKSLTSQKCIIAYTIYHCATHFKNVKDPQCKENSCFSIHVLHVNKIHRSLSALLSQPPTASIKQASKMPAKRNIPCLLMWMAMIKNQHCNVRIQRHTNKEKVVIQSLLFIVMSLSHTLLLAFMFVSFKVKCVSISPHPFTAFNK